jgi:ABC-type glycerol-3-phosphate transport system substrate-binding protein
MMDQLKTRREFLQLAGLAGMGVMLAACAPAAPQTTPGQEAEPGAPAPDQTMGLVAWFADRRTINAMTEEVMASEFQERNPQIQVEVVFVPEGEIPAKIATSFAGGNAPDLTALDETQLSGFLEQDFIHPIPEGLIDVEGEMGTRMADVYRYEGNYYALPNGNMPNCLFYNQDVLDQFGYTVDDIPGTWDAFIEWAQELTVWEGDEVTQWGFTFVGTPYMWDSLLFQQDGFLFKNAKESNLADPRAVTAWQLVLDMVDTHRLETRFAPTSPQDRLGQGLAATATNFAFASGFLVNEYGDTNWGTTVYPTFDGDPPYVRSSDDLGFCVTTQRGSDAMDATWTLWRYLVGPDYQRRYAVLRGVQPSLLELHGEEQFTVDNPQWAGIAVHTRPGNFRADGVWSSEIDPYIWQEAWERIINQQEPIETVLSEHAAQIDRILAEQNLPFLFGEEGWQEAWDRPA